jgi:hypothetical protein
MEKSSRKFERKNLTMSLMYFVNCLERILSCVSDVSDSEDIRGYDGSVAKPGDLKQQESDH